MMSKILKFIFILLSLLYLILAFYKGDAISIAKQKEIVKITITYSSILIATLGLWISTLISKKDKDSRPLLVKLLNVLALTCFYLAFALIYIFSYDLLQALHIETEWIPNIRIGSLITISVINIAILYSLLLSVIPAAYMISEIEEEEENEHMDNHFNVKPNNKSKDIE